MENINQFSLPDTGFLKIKQILQFIPVGETTWRLGVKEGHFPQSVRVADRVNLWRVKDIRDLIDSFNPKSEDSGGRQPFTKPDAQMQFNFNNQSTTEANNE